MNNESQIRDAKRKALETRLQVTLRQFERTSEQLALTLDPGQQVILEEKADKLSVEMDKLGEEIREQELTGSEPQRRDIRFQEIFPEIDYEKAFNTVESIFKKHFGRDPGAALFLIQKNVKTGGRWCVDRIRMMLCKSDAKVCSVLLSPFTSSRLDALGLFEQVGRHFGVDKPIGCDLQEYCRDLRERICQCIGHGNAVVFIEIGGCDFLQPLGEVLRYFREEFWKPLVETNLPTIDKYYVRVVVVFLVDHTLKDIPSELANSLFCTTGQFEMEKFMELEMESKWPKDYIVDWLGRYSSNMVRSRVDEVAELIYRSSGDGEPHGVYTCLRRYFDEEGTR